MLQSIRDRSQGWFTWIIIGVICLAFALWGIHNYMSTSPDTEIVAKVGSSKITLHSLQRRVQQIREQQQAISGQLLANDDQANAELRQAALQHLIQEQLMRQGNHRLGLAIAPQQAKGVVAAVPQLQEDGHFSKQRFKEALSMMSISYSQLLQQVSQDLMGQQLQQGVIESAFALPTEIKQLAKLIDQERDFYYGVINPEALIGTLEVTDKELHRHYEANPQQFQTPEQVKVDYVLASREKLGLDESEFVELQERVSDAAYTNSGSLEEVAKLTGQQIQRSGFFAQNEPLLNSSQVANHAFTKEVLEEGYNSELIPINGNQFVVLRLAERQSPRVKAFSEVKEALVQQTKQSKAKKQAQTMGEELLKQLQAGKAIVDLPEQKAVAWHHEVGATRDRDSVSQKILQTAFQLNPQQENGTVAGTTLRNGTFVIVKLEKIRDGEIAEGDDLKQKAFAKQIAQSFGQLDFALYQKSMEQKIKVKVYNRKLANDAT